MLDGKASAGLHFGFEGTEHDAYLASSSVGCTHLLILFSTLLKIEVPGMLARRTKLPQRTKARTLPFYARRGGLVLGCCHSPRISNLYAVECVPGC